MASITTRETGTTGTAGVTRKDLPLTNAEIDNNFINLNNNKLETSFTGSSNIVTLGTVSTGTWNATTIATTRGGTGLTSFTNGGAVYATSTSELTTGTLPVASGGTGQTTFTNGQLLIGNTTGNTLTKATLTGTDNRITVTNGSGSITLTTPQDIAATSNVQFNSLGIGTAASNTPGEIRATGDITSNFSDERLKENIKTIENALDKINNLRGVSYNANPLAEAFGFKKETTVGVLAQDVKQVLPEAIKPAPFDIIRIDENTEISRSGENYMTVQYEKIIPVLVEAIKELHDQVKELKGIK
jgi:hypothetical protein